jgi:hypothetical protein
MKRLFSMTLDELYTYLQLGSAILLGLTFLVGSGAIFAGHFVNKRQSLKISAAGQIAAQAGAVAAKAGADAAAANVRSKLLEIEAGKQRERAAKAEKELLELQQRLAPRRLTAEQQRTLASKLRPFSGARGNFVVSGDDVEITSLSNQILASFKDAGWIFGFFVGTDPSRSVSGILVEIAADADGPTKAAAETLASALLAENLSVRGPRVGEVKTISGMFSGRPVSDPKIRITIGKK